MAKYDWITLEKEFILSDYKSVSAFLKDKGISRNGNVQKIVKGWKNKKVQKEFQKSSKTIEKIVEQQSERDAQTIVKINDVAEALLKKVMKATNEVYTTDSIKKLTSALKDLKDIIPQKQEEEEDNSFIEALNGKIEDVWNEKE